jgi:hypothetical protein
MRFTPPRQFAFNRERRERVPGGAVYRRDRAIVNRTQKHPTGGPGAKTGTACRVL